MKLRPYQERAIVELRAAFARGSKRVILCAPTGAGKSVIAKAIVNLAVEKGSRVLFLVHTTELVAQFSKHLSSIGIDHGIIKAKFEPELWKPVQVASIQTLVRRTYSDWALVIIDECHRAMAKSYTDVLERRPKARVIGFTATAVRSDKSGLGDLFGEIIHVAYLSDLFASGNLIKPVVISTPPPDLSDVKTTAGDYNRRDLSRTMDTPQITGDVVRHWKSHARNARTLVFAVDVEHSRNLAAAFNAEGIPAAHLDAKSRPDARIGIMAALRAGELKVVCNVGLFTEGYDLPDLGCVSIVRPTQSQGLWAQMCGRVMRSAPGKDYAVIIDHCGSSHSLGSPNVDRHYELSGKVVQLTKICDRCFGVIKRSDRVCDICGYEYPLPKPTEPTGDGPRKAEMIDGELVVFEEDPTPQNYFRKVKGDKVKCSRCGAERRWGTQWGSPYRGQFECYCGAPRVYAVAPKHDACIVARSHELRRILKAREKNPKVRIDLSYRAIFGTSFQEILPDELK